MSGEGGEKAVVTSYSLEVLLVAMLGGGGMWINQYLPDYSVLSFHLCFDFLSFCLS